MVSINMKKTKLVYEDSLEKNSKKFKDHFDKSQLKN